MDQDKCLNCENELWAENLKDDIQLCHPCYIRQNIRWREALKNPLTIEATCRLCGKDVKGGKELVEHQELHERKP